MMLRLMVDFNAIRDGIVCGLHREAEGEPAVGDVIALDDGEGNTAQGKVTEITKGLVWAAIDWDTWGHA